MSKSVFNSNNFIASRAQKGDKGDKGDSSSGGGISGPGTTVVNGFALWNNTTGTILKGTHLKLLEQGTYGLKITGDNGGFETTLVYADNSNVGMGTDVFGSVLTTGDSNVAIGNDSMTAITSASFNTAVGDSALNQIDDGTSNVAIGYLAMQNSLTAEANVAVGYGALRQCDNVCNVAVGLEAGKSITSGDRNIAIGHVALNECTTGAKNTVIGTESMLLLTTGNRNVCVGSECLQTLQTGSDNVCVGRNCGNGYVGTETNNILIGNNVPGEASENNRIRIGSAQPVIFLSNKHFLNDTTGNILLGGYDTIPPTGTNNVCVGKNSLDAGAGNFVNSNCVLGQNALSLLTGGDNNCVVGDSSLRFLLSGNNNIVIGRASGNNLNGTESNNIIIGASITGNTGDNGKIRIGSTQNETFIAGIYNNSTFTSARQPVFVDVNGKFNVSTNVLLDAVTGWENLSRRLIIREFFLGNFTGGLGPTFTGTGAAVASFNTAASLPNSSLGVMVCSTGTTATGRAGVMNVSGSTAINTTMWLIGRGVLRFGTNLAIQNLSDGTETFQVLSGLSSSQSTNAPTNGLFWRYAHTLNGGNWQLVNRKNNVETDVLNTTTPIVAGTFVRLEVIATANGSSYEGVINDVSVGTLNVALANRLDTKDFGVGIMPGQIFKSVGTTSRGILLDDFYLDLNLSTPRF